MVYGLEVYTDDKDCLYVEVSEEDLLEFVRSVDDDVVTDFIEVADLHHDCVTGINRKRVTSYSYKEAKEDE